MKKKNIFYRIWICFINWSDWRKRRAIDKAVVALQGIDNNMSYKLSKISDALWKEAFDV